MPPVVPDPLALPVLALAAALAWAAGLRPYLVVLALAVASWQGWTGLPGALGLFAHPAVLAAAALMAAVEWRADRIRGLDCLWDAVHTPIRIPAGATLAALALWPQPLPVALLVGAAGGLLAASSHLTKSAVRALLHAHPLAHAPCRRLSLAEEVAAIGVLCAALTFPLAGLLLVALALVLSGWLAPRLWQRLARVRRELQPMLTGDRLRLSGLR